MRLQSLLPGLSQGAVLNLQPVSDPRESALQESLHQVKSMCWSCVDRVLHCRVHVEAVHNAARSACIVPQTTDSVQLNCQQIDGHLMPFMHRPGGGCGALSLSQAGCGTL